MEYASSTTINATPEQIWEILTDAAGMSQWDSGVVEVEGTIAPGNKIKVTSEANPGRAFAVTVTEFEPGKRMVWKGGMPLGLFTGERTYSLTPGAAGTEFSMREEYSGPLAGMMFKQIPDLKPSFDQFAAGLKAQAEGASGGAVSSEDM